MALAKPVELVSGETFNVGGEVMNFTLQELAHQIMAVEPDLDVEFVDNNDRRSYRVRFDKIRRTLGFQCHTSLRSGILGLKDAISRGLVPDYRDARYSNYRTLTNGVQHSPPVSEPEMEFTALSFAKNSLWWRMITANGAQNGTQDKLQTNGRVAREGRGQRVNAAAGWTKVNTQEHNLPPGKRLTDVAVSVVVLVLFAPAMALVALWIKLVSPGPVLYVARRAGLHILDPLQLLVEILEVEFLRADALL